MQDSFPVHTQPKQHQNSAAIRVLIVDDQKVIRAKIEAILSGQVDLEIVGMADDGDSAISQTKTLEPDVVLMDIEMPKMNGIEVTKIIAQQFSQTKILVLSTHEKKEYIQKIISAGADGYILKQTPVKDFVAAIHAVYRGYSHFGPSILEKVQLVSSELATPETQSQALQSSSQNLSQLVDQSPTLSELDTKSQAGSITSKMDDNSGVSGLSVVQVEEFLPSIEKWMTWCGISVMLTIMLILPLSSILKYRTKVRAAATVRPEGEVRLVQAKTEGQIDKILLKPGSVVKKGDVIALIDRSRLETQRNQLQKAISQEKLQLAQLSSQMATIDSQIVAERERNNAEILGAEVELVGSRRVYQERNVEVDSQLEEASAQLRAAEATLSATQTRLIRFQSAAKEGALSQGQLAETELEVKQQEQEIDAAKARLRRAKAALDPSKAEMETAKQQIQQAKKSGQASVAALNREREALAQQRMEVNQRLGQNTEELGQTETELQRTNLKATVTGEISLLNLRNPGQTVQLGQEIAQIIPQGGVLEIKAAVSPQDIGKLKVDQRVQMRVSACPYPDYGTLEGKVKRIAQDVTLPGNNGSDSSSPRGGTTSQQSPPFYEIFVTPENTTFGRKENQCILQPGMEGSTEIITREETVLRFILRKARIVSNV